MSGVLRSRRVVRSRHRLASDGLNHVLIFTMGVAVVRKCQRHPIEGVGSGTTPLKRYQVVVRMQDQSNCIRGSLESSEPIPFPYIMSGDIRVNGGCGNKGYVSGYLGDYLVT